ncbi:sigma-54-dependent Fis family transcriptional regulator [bacterium]|jgi:DNA-binding NtrC family response regulator|nr:sigma-54-dependent Fis family transcriptional regulator [bacterium]MBT4291442.1 sigma-54-dependent Fis family transcriptional regulator [bacterium]
MSDHTVLIVDDEESMLQYLSILLTREGYKVDTAKCGLEALQKMEKSPFDVVLTDIQMPGLDGIQVLKGIKAIDSTTPVIMITAYADEQTAIHAVNHGAYSYLHKHCKNDEIKLVVRNAVSLRKVKKENVQLKTEIKRSKKSTKIIGQSREMNGLFRLVDKIADTNATVLIHGESGTGKELIAKSIHEKSSRSKAPFVAINCGAIPETLLESQLFGHVKGSFTGADKDHNGFCQQAAGGTIFLDEIGETPLAIQVKLLRMLQEREIYPVGASQHVKVDLRVIAATNKDLAHEVVAGNFREDLFYRLNVIPVALPSLSQRRDDIPLLVDHFLKRHIAEYKGQLKTAVADEALNILQSYDWPGNVRELENVIERACIIRDSEKISAVDLPGINAGLEETNNSNPSVGTHIPLEDVEKAHIITVLNSVGGRKKQASEILDINPSTLYRKLLKYGIEEDSDVEAAEPVLV